MMDIREAIRSRRTVRRFEQQSIPEPVLLDLLEGARLAPSAANLQPLEFLLIDEPARREALFAHLKWGAYVKPRRDPEPDQRPTAYVVALWARERSSFPQWEAGAALQSIILAAAEQGIATCWLGGIDRDGIRSDFGVPDDRDVIGVIALGYPAEAPVLEERDDEVKYWLDDDDVLHVPKRSLGAVLHRNRY